MRKLLPSLAIMMLVALPVMAKIEVQGHPLIKPYPGSSVLESVVSEFDRAELPTGKIKFEPSTKGFVAQTTLKVEGKITAIAYRTPKNRSAREIRANYEQGLRNGGFEILYSCREQQCGKGKVLEKYFRGGVGAKETGLLTAKLSREKGDVFVTLIVDQRNTRTNLLVVEAKPMQTGLVKVDADALANEIDRTGHASIYGIYFDTGKADVKPESKQALGVIAKLLSNKPDLKLYVVGHTDNVGKLDYNKALSMRRAAAVVGVLTRDYGVDSGRLHPDGVGPLVPVMANGSDTGRARNRRVELVRQ